MNETKKQKLTKAQLRTQRRERRQRKSRIYRGLALLLVSVIAVLLILSLFIGGLPISQGGTNTKTAAAEYKGESVAIPRGYISGEGAADHLETIDQYHPAYTSAPATSGWHYGATAKWGEHRDEVPDEVLLHNLEHAGIGIHYNCVENCLDLMTGLIEISKDYHKIVLSPYSNMDHLITLTAWGYIDRMDSLEKERIIAFIDRHINSSEAPEPWAP